ncbi:MAG TPA: hypothetical protein VKV38_02415 [Trebonia sp.]|nr:hypothetical protein [Trebonia sp.]
MDTGMGRALGASYTGISVMFGIGFLTLWLTLAGYSIRSLSARAILAVTGYLRPRPDPWMEDALRAAFAEFDRELALILKDSGSPLRTATDQAGTARGRPLGAVPWSLEPPASGTR